jgi:hypothetical protein
VQRAAAGGSGGGAWWGVVVAGWQWDHWIAKDIAVILIPVGMWQWQYWLGCGCFNESVAKENRDFFGGSGGGVRQWQWQWLDGEWQWLGGSGVNR